MLHSSVVVTAATTAAQAKCLTSILTSTNPQLFLLSFVHHSLYLGDCAHGCLFYFSPSGFILRSEGAKAMESMLPLSAA